MNKFTWYNPLHWLEACGDLLRGILEFFGFMKPKAPQIDHDNIQFSDIQNAERDAKDTVEAIEAIAAELTPAQIVRSYCRANEDVRKEMNLSKLSPEQQDWLLNLSDGELAMLGACGEAACGRAARELKIVWNMPALRRGLADREAAPILSTGQAVSDEEKWDHIRQHFDDLLRSLTLGVPNADLQFQPSVSRTTVH